MAWFGATSGNAGDGSTGGGALVCEPASESERGLALSLLLTGRILPSEVSVDGFLRYAREHHLDIRRLWVGRAAGRIVLSALLIPHAGRTGLLFVSPNLNERHRDHARQLVTAACGSVSRDCVSLVQVLLEPGQDLLGQVLLAAGFRSLAYLIHMKRAALRASTPLELPDDVSVTPWEDQHREVYRRVILETYQQTLDCPGLLGLRHIDDIIDGHMATGEFWPDLWMALRRGDEPVAVMLLNGVAHRQALELVYLGLAPAWRGQGLARRLLVHGLDLAAQRGFADMLLAVDQDNAPAMRLYQNLGFEPEIRKHALIWIPA